MLNSTSCRQDLEQSKKGDTDASLSSLFEKGNQNVPSNIAAIAPSPSACCIPPPVKPYPQQTLKQRMNAQQKLHVQTSHLSNSRRKRQTSTFPVASYPQHKKLKWISTKKIAKHKGNLIFHYSASASPDSPIASSSCNIYQNQKDVIRKKVYAVLTDKKMELFETSQPFSLPDMICQSPVPTPTGISAKFPSIGSSNSFAALTSSSNNAFQNLIMINDNQMPSLYDSEHQGNVGLIGKIYLCPQICRGRVQVIRAGKTSFRIIVTGESPKTGPELNMNHELLTPTSAATSTPFETLNSSTIDPKSPYFSNSLHAFTSSSAVNPQVGENMTPTTTISYPFKFPPVSMNANITPSVNIQLSDAQQQEYHHNDLNIPSTVASTGTSDVDNDIIMKNAVSPHDDNCQNFGTSRGKFEIGNQRSESDNFMHTAERWNNDSNPMLTELTQDKKELRENLFFETANEMECNEWIMYIQQVISSLNNRNAYLIDEILLYIFSFLDAFDLCKSVAPASVKFMTLAQNELLWHNLYMAQWKKKEYSIMYYSAMIHVAAPYVLSKSGSASHARSSRRSSICSPLVTWKYIYTKRYYCEKKYLKKEVGSNEKITVNLSQTNNNANTLNELAYKSENVDPAELEKRKKEAEELKRREQEERAKQISSEYLKDGNTLFNAADYEKDVQTKRLLWVFCIDQYDACLIYNPNNWTAARNWAVALIRLEKLVSNYRGEVQDYLKMILELCVSKFEACMELTPNNDEVLTLWAGFLSDLALKIHDPAESDRLFTEAHKKFQQALNIKPYIGTYNDYGISFCDMAEKKIRQLKRRLNMNRSNDENMGNGDGRSHVMDEEDMDGSSEEEGMIAEEEIEAQKTQILSCLEGSSKLYEKCLQIQPDYFHAINNMGFNQKLKIDLIRIGSKAPKSEEIKQQRKRLVREACEYFARCVSIKDFVIARNNWGNILLQEAKEHEGEERYSYLQQCIEQYKRAMELEPSNDGCVCRCAIAYLMSAEIRLKDLKRAQDNLNEITNHINMLQQKDTINENTHNRLKEYIHLAQQQHEIVQQITMQTQRMYEEASQGFLKLKNKGLSLYNLSCLNAVFAKEEEAKRCLLEAYDYGNILTSQKLKEDSDFDSIRHCDWFKQLLCDLQDREKIARKLSSLKFTDRKSVV